MVKGLFGDKDSKAQDLSVAEAHEFADRWMAVAYLDNATMRIVALGGSSRLLHKTSNPFLVVEFIDGLHRWVEVGKNDGSERRA